LGRGILAQITTGSLSGTVTDPADAVVAAGKVEVTNQGTVVITALVTNAAGVFKAPFLIPGNYTVRVQSPGFRTFEAKDIVVELAHEPVVIYIGTGNTLAPTPSGLQELQAYFHNSPTLQNYLKLSQRRVIRAGFSIAYDPAFYNLFLNATAAPVVFAYTLSGSFPPMPPTSPKRTSKRCMLLRPAWTRAR
jgi:hypothetical protein